MMLAVWLLSIVSPAAAKEASGLQLQIDEKVIYCNASLSEQQKQFTHALKDGIPVATVWQFEVERLRDYWLGEQVAEVVVVRRVVPDLLSKSWLLEDRASGISHRVHSMDRAISFLTSIQSLPLLDRTLLTDGERYRLYLTLKHYSGEVADGWWNDVLTPALMNWEQEFALQ